MRVRITRERKRVLDFVVQYEAFIDEAFRPVVRHDGSHGVSHRDLLDWSGATIDKRWAAEGTTMNDALNEAIRDIQSNWEYYRAEFLRRRQ
jgi:hypothetical protein